MDLNLRDIKKSYGEGDGRQEVLRGITFYVAPWGVPFLIVTGIACYFFVNFIIMRRIRKIPMADALKDVE